VRANIEIDCSSEPPPPGAPVIVQVRDTSVADAAATIVAEARTTVEMAAGQPLAKVEFELPDDIEGKTVWALIDVDRDGGVSRGDYITKQSFPLRSVDRMRVTVSRVG